MAYLLKENILFLIQKVFTQFFKRHSSKVVTKLVVFVCRKQFLTEVVPGFVLRYKASTRRLLTILAPWCNIHVLMYLVGRCYTRTNIKMFPRSPHEIENQYITYYMLCIIILIGTILTTYTILSSMKDQSTLLNFYQYSNS